MKKHKRIKKLTLDKETIAHLQQVVGGVQAPEVQRDSGGPIICWISDCNPCDTDFCTLVCTNQ